MLRNKEDNNPCGKAFLFKVLPFVPASLPTLLFCRITELTICVEGSDLIEYEVWEEMVMKRSELMDMSNDIKLIGELNDIMENLALVPAMIFLS